MPKIYKGLARGMTSKRALVVVLGDVSQSPRMMNHAKSLSDAGFLVDVIGYVKGNHYNIHIMCSCAV